MSDKNDPSAASPGNPQTPLEQDVELLEALEVKMRAALDARGAEDHAEAEKIYQAILRDEPRLAEPRLELSHMAAMREDWPEAQEQARTAVDCLRRGGAWTVDLKADELLSFSLNLLGEVMVRSVEEGDLFLTDRPRFVEIWNEANGYFLEAVELNAENEDARRNTTRYRRLDP